MSSTLATTVAPLRYQPSYEHPEPDEAKTLADINEQMHRIQEKTYADGGKAIRSVHAKSHGLLVGELRIPVGLAPELAQGIFARPGTLPVVIRLSTTPGDILPDDVSTPRAMAVKIIGVEGERLPGSEGDVTQDFILVNGPAFNKPDASSFAATSSCWPPPPTRPKHEAGAVGGAARPGEGGRGGGRQERDAHLARRPSRDQPARRDLLLAGAGAVRRLLWKDLRPAGVSLVEGALQGTGRPEGQARRPA